MAAQKVVVEGSSVTALQLKDMFRQFADGSLNGEHVQAFIEHRNPFEETYEKKPTKDHRKLLSLISTTPMLGAVKFKASEHFKVDTSENAKVKIAFLWDNFKTHFVPKVEENVPAGERKIHKLVRDSLDAPIIETLGDVHETYLADLWTLLELQPNGEEGHLLVNGYANIFYIKDKGGVAWAVDAHWNSGVGGWGVDVGSVSGPGEWSDGRQVVSR